MNGVDQTYPDHDCGNYIDQIWRNTATYNLIECGICKRIIKFRYKSTWKQLKMLFWDRIK